MALKPSIRGLTSHVGVCDTTLNESCSEEHINVISQDLPWRLVAPYLDLTATDIDDIDHGGEESEKRRKALLRWKEKQAYLATYKKLIEALLAIGYATTAERVCNLLKGVPHGQAQERNPVQPHSDNSSSGFSSSRSDTSGQDSPLDCNCEDGCSVFSFLTKSCPNPHPNETAPVLKDDNVRRRRFGGKYELQVQTENLRREFTPLLSQTCSSFKSCGVRVCDIIQHIVPQAGNYRSSARVTQKRVLIDCTDQLQQAQTLDDLFRIFPHYMSCYDISLLEDLIHMFGDEADRRRLEVYKGKLSEYMHSRSVEAPEDLDFGSFLKMRRKVMLLKVDKEWDATPMRQVDRIHRRVAAILSVDRRDLFLCSVRRGCILLKFLVTRCVAREVFPLSSYQREALREGRVMMITCGWYYKALCSHKPKLTPVLQAIVKSKTQMSKARHIIHRSDRKGGSGSSSGVEVDSSDTQVEDEKRSTARTRPPDDPARSTARTRPPDDPARSTARTRPPADPEGSTAWTLPPADPEGSTARTRPPADPEGSTARTRPPDDPEGSTAWTRPPADPEGSTAWTRPPADAEGSTARTRPPDDPEGSTAWTRPPADAEGSTAWTRPPADLEGSTAGTRPLNNTTRESDGESSYSTAPTSVSAEETESLNSAPPHLSPGCGCGKCDIYTMSTKGCSRPNLAVQLPILSATTDKRPFTTPITCPPDDPEGPTTMACLLEGSTTRESDGESGYGSIPASDSAEEMEHTIVEQFRHESQMESETKEIRGIFADLVSDTYNSMAENAIICEVQLWLKQLDAIKNAKCQSTALLAECMDDIMKADSMMTLFMILSDYWSWWNHSLLEMLIDKFGDEDDQRRLQQFKEQFANFCKRRVCELPQKEGIFGVRRGKRLVVEVDKNWEEIHINELSAIQHSISSILGIPEYALYLTSVSQGCIRLEFQIPAAIDVILLTSDSPDGGGSDGGGSYSPGAQVEALMQAEVILLMCGGIELHCSPTTGFHKSQATEHKESGEAQTTHTEDDQTQCTEGDQTQQAEDEGDGTKTQRTEGDQTQQAEDEGDGTKTQRTEGDQTKRCLPPLGELHTEGVRSQQTTNTDHNPDPDDPDLDQFRQAVTRGDADWTDSLLNSGHINVDTVLVDGRTALMVAAGDGHDSVVKILLQHKAVVARDKNGFTALMLASQEGHDRVVTTLLMYGASPNLQTENGRTALMEASRGGHLDVVRLLLDQGANMNLQDSDGETAVFKASMDGHSSVVQELLQGGADPNIPTKNGRTALMEASRGGCLDVVRLLLDQGANVNLQDSDGETAVFKASMDGHSSVVQELLQGGADPNIPTKNGRTALMEASRGGHLYVVQLILDQGANVNLQDSDGETAVFKASMDGHSSVVQELLQGGADPNIPTKNGRTALMEASRGGYLDIVQLILAQGANVNLQDSDGETAVFKATMRGHSSVVQELLQSGADPDTPTKNGFTALMLASQEGHDRVVTTLLMGGASPNLLTEATEHKESGEAQTTHTEDDQTQRTEGDQTQQAEDGTKTQRTEGDQTKRYLPPLGKRYTEGVRSQQTMTIKERIQATGLLLKALFKNIEKTLLKGKTEKEQRLGSSEVIPYPRHPQRKGVQDPHDNTLDITLYGD